MSVFANGTRAFLGTPALACALLGLSAGTGGGELRAPHALGLESLREEDLVADLLQLATAPLEGRDTPSAGLERAGAYIEERLSAAGYAPWADLEEMRFGFPVTVNVAVPEACSLSLRTVDGVRDFAFGDDFVPLAGTSGRVEGDLVFAGYGIESSGERYNDLRLPLKGKVALILEGEPRHKRKFDGPEVTQAADVYAKLRDLEDEGALGAIIVRRAPLGETLGDLEGTLPGPARLGFRSTWARWSVASARGPERADLPALEVSVAVADALLGHSVMELAERIDKRAKPVRHEVTGRSVSLAAASTRTEAQVDNIVAALAGSDPEVADQVILIGAHYDHVGVDARGRIGFGADDNASGVAVMLEVAEALAQARPRRTIVACAFAAEEDGLLGSRALCAALPVRVENLVAMLNLDMVGRGAANQIAVLGTEQNPDLEKVVKAANKLSTTGIKKMQLGKGQELFERSDHYSFHRIDVPALFFFEGLPISRNEDYHTWRDTVDKLDLDKMNRTSKLVYNTAWLLATNDDRPGAPQ